MRAGARSRPSALGACCTVQCTILAVPHPQFDLGAVADALIEISFLKSAAHGFRVVTHCFSRATCLKNAPSPPGDMDSLEAQLELLLKGEGIEVQGYDSPLEDVVPVTVRKTVCYIVAAVILNEQVRGDLLTDPRPRSHQA
ncbi:hypothetical protein chiPu_0026606 [Chiloscyllium punctatum]|uniref:Uncharacterized protein n=1 Tax=Chiloscyllium punctatum TaxID=137246 RepID=A0A401TJN3_CHIPU|nr:hypothetical protein [Chiloscyllium punctatum]